MVESSQQKDKEQKQLNRVGIVFVMIDGISDHSSQTEEAKMQTPLESADVATLDALCSQGVFGVHDPV